MDNWVKIQKPLGGRIYAMDKVSVSFSNYNINADSIYVSVSLGVELCKKLGLSKGDYVDFFIDKDDDYYWKMAKTDKPGFKVKEECKVKSSYTVTFTFKHPAMRHKMKKSIIDHRLDERGFMTFVIPKVKPIA